MYRGPFVENIKIQNTPKFIFCFVLFLYGWCIWSIFLIIFKVIKGFSSVLMTYLQAVVDLKISNRKQADHRAQATSKNPCTFSLRARLEIIRGVCCSVREELVRLKYRQDSAISIHVHFQCNQSNAKENWEGLNCIIDPGLKCGHVSLGFLLSTQSSGGRKHDMWIRLCIRLDPALIRQAALLNLIQCSRDKRGAPSDCICCSVTVYVPLCCVNAQPPPSHTQTRFIYHPKGEQ